MRRVRSLGLLVIPLFLSASLYKKTMNRSTETAPPAEWQQRLDKHLAAAKRVLTPDDDFHPIAVYVMPDGSEEFAILVFSPAARERAIADVTRQARERGCRGLILVGDTWSAPEVPGREPRAGDAVKHPQREEGLLLTLFTPNGAWGRTVPYRRQGKKIRFQQPEPWFRPDSPWNPWEHVQ